MLPCTQQTPCVPPAPPQAELGDNFQLFLLEDKEEKPTAVVLPRAAANEGTISKFTEVGGVMGDGLDSELEAG